MTELLERDDLLAQLEEWSDEGGAFSAAKPVLHGSCENLATPTPLGPFLDVGLEVEAQPRYVALALLRELERTPLARPFNGS